MSSFVQTPENKDVIAVGNIWGSTNGCTLSEAGVTLSVMEVEEFRLLKRSKGFKMSASPSQFPIVSSIFCAAYRIFRPFSLIDVIYPLHLSTTSYPLLLPKSYILKSACPSPFKSSNLAEEVVLRRLEGLCRAIEDVWSKGAVLHIVSDGVVYAELLGVSDTTVYRYNAELRRLAKEYNLNHISFVRVSDMHRSAESPADHPVPVFQTDLTESEYVESAPKDRAKFIARDIGEYSLEKLLAEDVGALRTYRGYLKFLKLDLAESHLLRDENGKLLSNKQRERIMGCIAKDMMRNGTKFSHLVQAAFPHALRLSIHPHNNAGPKLALKVFPYVDIICTPWHNVLCQKADGSTTVGQVSRFDDNNHEIVYKYGRPYYVREKDADMAWEGELSSVTFERIYPFGLRITAPENGDKPDFAKVPMDK
ncbi:hypothetical protein FRC03_000854, partial [Tulasnella sp. 419]